MLCKKCNKEVLTDMKQIDGKPVDLKQFPQQKEQINEKKWVYICKECGNEIPPLTYKFTV